MQQSHRLALFPDTATISNNALSIGGRDLAELADRFGTPLYVYDRATLDNAARTYKAALRRHYAGEAFITYAAKAFLCAGIARWVVQQALWIDCTGQGDISIAVDGRVPPSSIVVHGVNKSEADLDCALRNAGTLVLDNGSEARRVLRMLSAFGKRGGIPLKLESAWLRLRPGVSVATHHGHTQTGQSDSKFGMTQEELAQVARLAREGGLKVDGLHFHLGSNFREVAPLARAIDLALEVASEIGMPDVWHFSPGGGWGVAYNEDELPWPPVEQYVQVVAETTRRRCRALGISLPILHIEPGRSLIARAGVAIYRVGVVKRRQDRTWLLVDGGMSDNPRYAMYGARYSCLPVNGAGREMVEEVAIGGLHCESGDVLIENLILPRIDEGELLAIPVSGAYQLSMSSNYNGACRPAVAWIENGKAELMVRRETAFDLARREVPHN
ncbi:MAG: diaminopimelate decarboxylase [Anaerolineales bacterium]